MTPRASNRPNEARLVDQHRQTQAGGGQNLSIALEGEAQGFLCIVKEVDVPGGPRRIGTTVDDGAPRYKAVRIAIRRDEP
jgi:hypothetical protein